MSGLLGKKLGMTSIFNEDGNQVPVTIIQAGPCKILRVKTNQRDGYTGVQLGFGSKKDKNVSKPVLGYYKKNNLETPLVAREFRVDDSSTLKVGDEVSLSSMFKVGEVIKVRGTSKGKGFQGVIRRHNFSGVGGATHGQSDRERAPGSIGASSYPSRVFKGQKMAGRMGSDSVTIRNLKIMKIVEDKNIVLVQGAVPGSINSIVELLKK